MDKHYTYLLINFLTILFPLILSFDKKVAYYKQWKYLFPALAITGGVFLVWDYLFTVFNVWSFNSDYVVGLWVLHLPIEEILFFLTVPFSCLFIYECLSVYFKLNNPQNFIKIVSWLLVLLSAVLLFYYLDKVYTLITFGLLFVLVLASLKFSLKFLPTFYIAFLITLIPFYLVNGLLTSIPVVMYNNQENMAIRIGTIPLEDHFYSLAMLLMNVQLFELFRRKSNG